MICRSTNSTPCTQKAQPALEETFLCLELHTAIGVQIAMEIMTRKTYGLFSRQVRGPNSSCGLGLGSSLEILLVVLMLQGVTPCVGVLSLDVLDHHP